MEERDYRLAQPTWCRGCGIYGILAAFKRAAAAVDLDPEMLVIVTGIGCHGRFNNYFKCYGFHGLHGRTLPLAIGVKLSNPDLQVVSISGDGDAYSIGLNHFLHAIRRNVTITCLVVNNQVYALTQGQTSPTSQRGFISISTPAGSQELPLDGLKLALAAGATYVARGFSGEPAHLASLIKRGLKHKGFSMIEVLSPCVTHNKINTYQWYRDNINRVDKSDGYDPKDIKMAWQGLLQNQGKIPVGLIYEKPTAAYESLVLQDKEKPLIHGDLKIRDERLEEIMDGFE
jgi:2-oxoglutarate ferredoxin oxidoreductase subunit beta